MEMSARYKNAGSLRIEIWMNDSLEWSLQGDGSAEQYRQAQIKAASLFPGEKELRLCDPAYERMMAFIYE